jgi:hypothetical protein
MMGEAATAGAQQMGCFQPNNNSICSGPLGPGPCHQIADWMWRNGVDYEPDMLLPRDGQIVAAIGRSCGGNPYCMAAAWASVEVERCRDGIGTPGGCFGPNGEIMRIINRILPEHLHPDVIGKNIDHDLQYGMGKNNEIRKFFHF